MQQCLVETLYHLYPIGQMLSGHSTGNSLTAVAQTCSPGHLQGLGATSGHTQATPFGKITSKGSCEGTVAIQKCKTQRSKI